MIIPAQTELHPPSAGLSLEQLLAYLPRWDLPRLSGGDITQVEICFHSPAERIAALVGERSVTDELDATTDHAWLVVLGQFAQAFGLVQDLEGVPIDQKQGLKCRLQTKLIELLVGILGGIEYLQDLNLVQARRQTLQARIQQAQDHLSRNQGKGKVLRASIVQNQREAKTLQAEVVRLENEYQLQGWQERPHSQLAKTRHQQAAARKREQRAWREAQKVQTICANQEDKMRTLQEQLTQLDEWLAELEADNQDNPNPVTFVLRIDAGFSTGSNLAWLIEMGYIVLTKAHHASSSQSLRGRLVDPVSWTRVGRNAQAVHMSDYYQHDCPYPLQAMLIRYHLPDELRHTTLLYYADTPPPALPQWFRRYNARQTIEAGIKEEKGVFTLKRHLVRSPIGMQLQEQFALFAANFVRWAAAWVKDALRQANHRFESALTQIKTLVRIVSHTPARWVRNSVGNTLIFDPDSPFAQTILCFSGQVAVQLTLPLFKFKTL